MTAIEQDGTELPEAGVGEEPLIFTPAKAAAKLGVVTETWLRRKAREGRIPCTRLDGFLGFSRQNLEEITDQFNTPVRPKRRGR